MHLLITSGDFARHLFPNTNYLLDELGKLTDLTVWHESGDIQDILSQLDKKPDFILIYEFEETKSPTITGLSSLSIPFAVSLHDLHYQIDRRKDLMRRGNVQHVFSHYRDKFYEWYPDFWKNLHWLPHHVNTDVFHDYGLSKDIDYLMMGVIHDRVYPLRYKILKTMEHRLGFVYHEHPGYGDLSGADQNRIYIRENYAREINRAKIFLTCYSVYMYPLAKYFEVLACNTLLLAPPTKELEDLGFVDGVTFVAIDETDFLEKAEYYLNHEEERLKIAQAGYEMVQARHSTKQRARDLVNMIEKIINSR